MDFNCSGIYKITAPSGRCYVGSAVNFRRRWNCHRARLRAGRHHCPGLQKAAAKYGVDALKFEILELADKSELLVREQLFLDRLWGRLYNCAKLAGSTYGVRPGAQTRAKISKALTGLVRPAETRARMAAAQRGKKLSASTRRKISEVQVGRKQSLATARKRGAALTGRVHKDNQTGFVGVGPFRGKFRARWKSSHLGVFLTAEEAYAAVCVARDAS